MLLVPAGSKKELIMVAAQVDFGPVSQAVSHYFLLTFLDLGLGV